MHRTGHEGYRISPAQADDAAALARIHVDSWRSAYRGILPDAFLDALSYGQREDLWRRVLADRGSRHLLVARESEGPIVGFVLGGRSTAGASAYDAELHALYVLEAHQRRGVGTGLFRALVTALVEEGSGSLLAWVFAQTPSVAFCAHLGGHRVDERSIEVAGHPVDEIGFVWTELVSELARRPPE